MTVSNFENEEIKDISIKYCKCCGNYDFTYRFFRCHLKYDSLVTILQGMYEYEDQLKNDVKIRPFKFKLSGIALITILFTDFKNFKNELENAVFSEKMSVNNLNELITKFDLSLNPRD